MKKYGKSNRELELTTTRSVYNKLNKTKYFYRDLVGPHYSVRYDGENCRYPPWKFKTRNSKQWMDKEMYPTESYDIVWYNGSWKIVESGCWI